MKSYANNGIVIDECLNEVVNQEKILYICAHFICFPFNKYINDILSFQ